VRGPILVATAMSLAVCAGCYESSTGDDDALDGAARDDAGRDDLGWDDLGRDDLGRDDGPTDDSSTPTECPSRMVRVPAGPVVLGSDPGEGDSDEEPEHVVTLSEFCIDTFEVTNRDYFQCVAGGECTLPYSGSSRTRAAYFGNTTYDGFPVINVDWAQAASYCAWVGKRLPTEAEWEKAARGGCEVAAPESCGAEDERTYPWGDVAPDCTFANFVACVGDTIAVDDPPAGASPYGIMNMAGNISEWVADWYAGTYYDVCADGTCLDPQGPPTGSERVFRGGAWDSAAPYLRNANRFRQVDGYSNDNLGFRCAASLAH
jgi:formylglycine-generating enzyme required for sulfatase activity